MSGKLRRCMIPACTAGDVVLIIYIIEQENCNA